MTPASFRFTCKLPRQITHICRLRDCAAELISFLRAIELLGPKLQVILVQLPPSLTPADGKHALRKFLVQLPRDFRFAIEFRHAGWHRPQFIRLVEKYRICWVWADTTPLNERNLAPFEFLPCTTDFLYLRLLGDYATKYDVDGGHMHRYEKLLWKREAALESWSLENSAASCRRAQCLGICRQSLRRVCTRDVSTSRRTARLRSAAAAGNRTGVFCRETVAARSTVVAAPRHVCAFRKCKPGECRFRPSCARGSQNFRQVGRVSARRRRS